MSVRSRDELKKSLLKRAFDENRGEEMKLLIEWRLAALKHTSSAMKKAYYDFEAKNAGNTRTVRMLNLLAEKDGSKRHYLDIENPFNIMEEGVH